MDEGGVYSSPALLNKTALPGLPVLPAHLTARTIDLDRPDGLSCCTLPLLVLH
jgi:hypothetical protein